MTFARRSRSGGGSSDTDGHPGASTPGKQTLTQQLPSEIQARMSPHPEATSASPEGGSQAPAPEPGIGAASATIESLFGSPLARPATEHAASSVEPGRRSASGQKKPVSGATRIAPEDAATVAVENKGLGAAADAKLAHEVGSYFSTDVSTARVHDDPLSQQATAAMGARAFAHRNDIFLGPGESGTDTALMAHELTHVAQQRGGIAQPQRKVTVGDANHPSEAQADQVAAMAVAGQLPAGALIVDDAPLHDGQVLKTAFIAQLKDLVTAVVDHELGSAGSAIGCPYIAEMFARYADRPAAMGEAMLRKWVPALKDVKNAHDMIPPTLDRVRTGIQTWRRTGQVPADLIAVEPSLVNAPPPPDQARAKSLDHLEAELGPGQPLDAGTAARMSAVIRSDISSARIHTGPVAAAKAAEAGAAAFAVGTNVVMGAAAQEPGSLVGDALLAHELAHVAQQKDAAADPVARRKPIGKEDAAAEADAGLGRLANFGTAVRDVMKTGLQLQRCGSDKVPAKQMDRARYQQIEAKLKDLIAQKRGIVDGSKTGDMTQVDQQIDALISELRTDFGVRLDKDKILADVDASKDMLVVDGRIVLDPSTGEHYRGERLGVQLEVDHVPPGEELQVGWRWTTPQSKQEYYFLNGAAAISGEKTKVQQFTLDTAFWHIVPADIVKAQGLTIIAKIYVGDVASPTKEFNTGFISMPDRPIPDIQVVNAPDRVVQGSALDLQIGPYTPDQSTHSVDWYVDDQLALSDAPNFHHKFGDVGPHTVRAELYEVDRMLGIRSKKLVKKTEPVKLEVLTNTDYGDKFLDDLEKSPFRPKQVSVKDTLESGDKALVEIQHHIDQGGSEVPYWQDRLKAQKERLGKIKELTPDFAAAKPLPNDPTQLDPGTAYSGPITAALVMSTGGGGAQPLTIHLSIKEAGGVWHARLLDSTSKKVAKHDGSGATPLAAYEAAFETWHTDNEYPTGGRVAYRFTPTGWAKGNGFDTTTAWKKAKEWVDGILQIGGFVIGALLIADPDPTVSKAIGAVLMAAVVARSSVSIYERIRNGGDVLSSENILDAIAIVTSFMGIGSGMLRTAGLKAINPTMYRVGNWLIMGTLAADAGTFVYVAHEAIAQMKVIEADPTMDDGAKLGELLRIMAGLFAQGVILVVSNKELLRGGLKPTDFVASKLKPGQEPHLEIGERLDAEYELKKEGQWTKETSKLSDEALLTKVFNQRSRQEIEVALGKKLKPDEVKLLTAALGDDGMIALAKGNGEHLPDLVAEAGTRSVITCAQRVGAPATSKLLQGLGGKGLARLTDAIENIGLQVDTDASHGSYRWGGTGATEKALAGGSARVTKSADPAGARTLDVETPAGKLKLDERGRYADVRIDPAKLSPDDAKLLDKLFADFGVTDDAAKHSILEALENARVGNPSLDMADAIKKVRPALEDAKTSAKKQTDAGTPTTAQDVILANGKSPLVSDADGPVVAEAKTMIAGGILDDPSFKSARTTAEGRDAVSQRLQAATGKTRAEGTYGKSGGKVLTKVRFVGDLFPDATTRTPLQGKNGVPRVNTDVVPDLDVAYVVEAGGKVNVEYVAGVKIVKPASSAKARADAANQNVLGKAAVEAGDKRFGTTTRDGDHVWAEVKSITGVDDTGATVDLTGKLTWDPAAKTETIGSKGTKGFDATLPVAAQELDKIVEMIWRLAEMRKR